MKKLYLYLNLIGLLFASHAWAQNNVTGTVIDDTGLPLPGATVIVEGTNRGVATDFDGNFTIQADPGDVLIVSYVGYTDERILLGNQDNYSITLSPGNELEEVVVTSLGIQREKQALGYAISEVDEAAIEQRAEGDIGRVLSGKASGVQITNQSGISGSGTSIIIRGFNTFSQGNQPLFIVDGVPFSSETNEQDDFQDGNNGSSRFLDIDPNNIESVNVLKGLAAATLYGTQGRNGVILITTKSGSTQSGAKKNEITVNSSVFFNEIASLPDYQNQYGNGFDQSFGWFFSNWGPSFDEEGVAGWGNQTSINGTLSGQAGFLRHPFATASSATGIPQAFPEYADAVYEWKPYNNVEAFFNTGVIVNNSINIKGATDDGNVSYNLNVGHLDDEGFTPGNTLRRTSISLGGRAILTNKFTFNGTLNYSNTTFKSPPVAAGFGSNVASTATASIYANIFYTPRSIDLINIPYQNPITGESVYYRQNNSIQHPLWTLHNTGTSQDTHRVFGGGTLAFEINDNLNLAYTFGLDTYNESNVNYANKGGKTGSVANRSGRYQTWNNVKLLHDHNIRLSGDYEVNEDIGVTFVVGTTARRDVYNRNGISSTGQQVFNVLRHFNFAANDEIERFVEQNILGAYAQTEWDYQRLVYLTLAARKDWVSNLSTENNSIIYPSASVSFIPTKLWEGLQSENINYIKVRAGYGTSANFPGTQSIDDLDTYPIASILSFDTQDFQDSNGNDVITNTSGSQLGNSNLKPERVDEIELGLEGSFFNHRVSLDLSLYQRNTLDLIVEQPLDPSTGYTETQTNIGKIENKGIEIDLTTDIFRDQADFNWNLGFNFSSNEAIVVDLGQDTERVPFAGLTNGTGNAAAVGESLGAIWGTSIARDDQNRFLVNAAGSYVEDTALSIIGDANPNWLLNISNGLKYKDFNFNFLFNWTQGGDILSWTTATLLGRGLTTDTLDRENSFILPGVDSNGNPNSRQINNSTFYFSNVLYGPDELKIYDATVIRLQEISLGYSLPKSLLDNTPFGSVSLTAAGYNQWFYTPNIPEGTNFDPNIAGVGVGNGRGFDFLNGPSSKRYGLSLKLTF